MEKEVLPCQDADYSKKMNLFERQKQKQMWRTNGWMPRGEKGGGWDELGDWDLYIYTNMYKMDN